jgi:NRAMP (natural resistance-associated macrophage protein)-like metal ion transporter
MAGRRAKVSRAQCGDENEAHSAPVKAVREAKSRAGNRQLRLAYRKRVRKAQGFQKRNSSPVQKAEPRACSLCLVSWEVPQRHISMTTHVASPESGRRRSRVEEPERSSPGPGKRLLAKLGPGLITGASDDDPSGIATYSQVGAQFGYGLLWTMLLSYPLMAAIQEICARIGRVTGCGLAANLRKSYPKVLLYSVLILMSVANVFNLGADIGAMGASLRLLVPGKVTLFTVLCGIVSLLAVLFIPYSTYAKYLKWLTLSLFAYVGVIFFVQVSWRAVLNATLLPRGQVTKEFLMALIAVLGTTISPYLFFWQASQEAEEVKTNPGEKPLRHAPKQARAQLERIHVDTYVGMAFSNAVAFFIILTAASTLHTHGITYVSTCAQAAAALEPLAGSFASALFVCGIVGTGLLAVPVLAASAAYGIGEACGWRVSLEQPPKQAVRFYGAICAATITGLLLNFLHIDPVKALFWAAVLNGLVAAPLMLVIMSMASSQKVMGKFVVPSYLKLMGWLGAGIMMCACVGVFVMWKW